MAEPGPAPNRSIKVSRGEIALWERGAGPAVLCLHGFPDHAIGFLSVAEALAQAGRRALVPALPGYWPSDPVPDYGIEAVSGDLLGLLDELGLGQVAMVGHDWGAEIGYHLASRHPDRLSTFVALASPHPAGFAARWASFSEQLTVWYALFLAYSSRAPVLAGTPEWLTALAQSWSPGYHLADWPEIVALLTRPGVMEAVCAYYRADLDRGPEPAVVRVPTTIIYGAQDGCIHPICYEGLESWFEEGLRRVLVPGAGHWPHLERPDAVLPELLAAVTEQIPT